jgi:hypothetical protein
MYLEKEVNDICYVAVYIFSVHVVPIFCPIPSRHTPGYQTVHLDKRPVSYEVQAGIV